MKSRVLSKGAVVSVMPFAILLASTGAQAQTDPPQAEPAQPAQPTQASPPQAKTDTPSTPESEAPAQDPTGGAYTSPTLLFVPAAAVPAWNARVILSSALESPSDVHAGFQPGLGAELGLPAGFTLGAGTNWVGGDINPDTNKTDFNLGLSPYAQLRFNILGSKDGRGFLLGTSATYKFVGFEGDRGEVEWAISAQYRKERYELGLQGVVGKDFMTTDADSEIHAYALYRVIPQLGIGAAGQTRIALVSQPGETTWDVTGGGIASLTLGQFQVGALGGATTIAALNGQVGGLAQLFATARFGK